jgi:hypothetical protein
MWTDEEDEIVPEEFTSTQFLEKKEFVLCKLIHISAGMNLEEIESLSISIASTTVFYAKEEPLTILQVLGFLKNFSEKI